MAKVLKSFKFKPIGANARYPWELWFDGRIRELTQGVDFHSKVTAFRNHLYLVAKQKSLVVRCQRTGDTTIVVQAILNGTPEKP